jgi:hypothetical protein
VARYEELSVSPESTLKNIFERLDVEVEDTVIGDSISLFSFEKMSKRAKGCENLNSFFRKGIVGDWKNYFNDHHKSRFKSVAGELLIALGYEKDDNW